MLFRYENAVIKVDNQVKCVRILMTFRSMKNDLMQKMPQEVGNQFLA